MPFSRVCDLPSFKCFKAAIRRQAQLHLDLCICEFKSSNHLANEVGDMNCTTISLCLDRLLIPCKPHTPSVLICVEDSFILYNQDMFSLSLAERRWYGLESGIVIACHQAIGCAIRNGAWDNERFALTAHTDRGSVQEIHPFL